VSLGQDRRRGHGGRENRGGHFGERDMAYLDLAALIIAGIMSVIVGGALLRS